MTQYLYPQNLKAAANLWLWSLKDFCILGIATLLSIINKYRVMASKADEEFDEASKSIYNAIADFYERTFKNTEKIIFQKMSFFQKLENVNFVNIIGHSLGKVDMPYFKTVMNSINSNAEWNVYYYQNEEKDCLKDSLLSLGLSEEHIFLLPSSDFWDI